ncbi:MAG: Rieske 2Fe-2S domain-containing protein [Cyanosarcina radialis HA8281-LM2]|jgi:phenylpropionate dioxygenase-like ring-hydroxylating dioxygenase large terminal subunit|nr:Rieske 2Fe-2S domain-containing protein [Cyanosarcina radialis HA8281-LM2]
MKYRFPFTPFPNGWFRVAASDELPSGTVKSLHYFGKNLVLFRTEKGIPHILDAHCPHLGANLAYGGKVKGETIQCPFHGWCFNGEGSCTNIPYANKILPKARMHNWQVKEVNGSIFTYYHAEGKPPDWEIPEFPEYTSQDWVPFRAFQRWQIRSHVQEINENGIDIFHAPLVHPQQTKEIENDGIKVEGSVLRYFINHTYNLFWAARMAGQEVAGPHEITYYGLGCAVNRVVVKPMELQYLFMFLSTPIDEEYIELNGVFSMKKVWNEPITQLLTLKAIREGRNTISQDIPIWENKAYRNQPALCDSEGAIAQYRHWASQFYRGNTS